MSVISINRKNRNKLYIVKDNQKARKHQRRRIIITVVVGLALIQGGRLIMNIINAEQVYQLAEIKQTAAQLKLESQVINDKILALQSPQNLSQQAADLGMVYSTNPVYIKLKTQQVLGTPSQAYSTANAENLIANSTLD